MKKREERIVSRRALRNLSSKLYRADKRRNLTAVAAVAMSAMLVIVVLSTILTVSEMIKREMQMLLGTQTEGIYLGVSSYGYEGLRDGGYFDDVRLTVQMGTWKTELSEGDKDTIFYADEEMAGWIFNGLEEGNWPTGMDEIAVDRNFVEANGGDIHVGSRIQITLKTAIAETKKEAVVTGICAVNDVLNENRVYVSEDFFLKDGSFNFANACCRFEPGKYTDEDLKGFLLYIEPDAAVIAVANPYAGNCPGTGTIVIVVCLSALAAVCAGLMVYTIYYISAVRNAARYGQLKLLGVTERQIKKIVLCHAMWQYVTGFPVGCILGVVFAYVLMPFAASFMGLKDAALVLRLPYFLCAAAVSLVVVLFGSKKPMRILASVPPVHAAALADNCGKFSMRGKKAKRTHSVRFTAGSFARKNIRRRAKKTALVAASAAVVMVIFICTMNVVNSMNVDALMQNFNQFADIVVATEDVLSGTMESYPLYLNLNADSLPDGLEDRIAEVSGGMDMVCHYGFSMFAVLYGEDAGKFCSIVLGDAYRKDADEQDFGVRRALEYQNGEKSCIMAQYEYCFYEYGQVKGFEVYEGSIDREKFESGNYVLAVAQDKEGESLYHAGDVVSLYSKYPEDAEEVEHLKPDENGHCSYFDALPRKDYEVLAVVDDSYRRQMSGGDAHMGAALGFIFPTQAMEEMPVKPGLSMVTMYAPDADTLERVEPLVVECLEKEGGEDVSFRSRSAYKKQLEQFSMSLALIGNGFALLVGAMFIVNFLNSCVSGIAERKEEFATLQAIGMTRHRLIAVLRLENLYMVLLAVVPGYLIGQIVSMEAIQALSSRMNYLVWKPALLPGILLAAAMCVLAMAYPNRGTDVGTVVHL